VDRSWAPATNAGRYLDLMRVDKKAEAGEIRFVLIDGAGPRRGACCARCAGARCDRCLLR